MRHHGSRLRFTPRRCGADPVHLFHALADQVYPRRCGTDSGTRDGQELRFGLPPQVRGRPSRPHGRASAPAFTPRRCGADPVNALTVSAFGLSRVRCQAHDRRTAANDGRSWSAVSDPATRVWCPGTTGGGRRLKGAAPPGRRLLPHAGVPFVPSSGATAPRSVRAGLGAACAAAPANRRRDRSRRSGAGVRAVPRRAGSGPPAVLRRASSCSPVRRLALLASTGSSCPKRLSAFAPCAGGALASVSVRDKSSGCGPAVPVELVEPARPVVPAGDQESPGFRGRWPGGSAGRCVPGRRPRSRSGRSRAT